MAIIRFEENDDIIDICQDNVFKAVFTKNSRESAEALAGTSVASSSHNPHAEELTAKHAKLREKNRALEPARTPRREATTRMRGTDAAPQPVAEFSR